MPTKIDSIRQQKSKHKTRAFTARFYRTDDGRTFRIERDQESGRFSGAFVETSWDRYDPPLIHFGVKIYHAPIYVRGWAGAEGNLFAQIMVDAINARTAKSH